MTDFLIVTGATATMGAVWRMLLDDHPQLRTLVGPLPYVGGSLICGFCSTLWFSLAATLVFDPLGFWQPQAPALLALGAKWFALGAAALTVRNGILCLVDLGAILKHQHRALH